MTLEVKHTFDENTYRHSLNGHEFVLHCHHYMSLTTKMVEDFADLGGVRVLREATEDTIRPVLDSYFVEHAIASPEERLAIGAEYFKLMGMGLMKVAGSADGGEVTLSHSHVDEGWLKKWDKNDKPINHFTCGFVAAVFAAAYDKPARSYDVSETASIVMGAPESVLSVKPA
jgi:hypothetical protein